MSPEDDVKKESEVEHSDAAANDPIESTSADTAAAAKDHDTETGSAADDENVAQSANSEIEGQQHSAEVQSESDDPLGFGSARMDSAEEADAEEADAEEADAAAETDEGDELSQLKAQLEESETRVTSQQDQLLRLTAEMENQRKRAQNDVNKAHKFALEKIALDLLPVKDSLEMGLLAATGDDAELTKIVEGSELTLKMLAQALEKYNIVEVNPVDEKFDPEFHQAMSMQPVEGKEPNTVASVMQKGYTLNDRLIRAALVMVAK